uniref:Uncharacterized protein n=1 Tax=viral metagenome TaxID=1070528 RepID=A0A6C0HMV6_9ZZZZ
MNLFTKFKQTRKQKNNKTSNRVKKSKFIKFQYGGSLKPSSPIQNDIETLLKICAVHATNYFPEKMKIISGGVFNNKSDDTTARGRIHFALGTMAMPHGHSRDQIEYDNTWENKKYAIIVPLGHLVNQLLNLNCYDTFILGNYNILPDSIIIIPDDEKRIHHDIPDTMKVETYTPGTPIRQTIDEAITKYKYWNIKMENECFTDSIATIIGDDTNTNVNTSIFFESFLSKYPYVSWGSDADSEIGTAFRFHLIDKAIQNGEFNIAQFNYDKLISELTNMKFLPVEAREGWQIKAKQIESKITEQSLIDNMSISITTEFQIKTFANIIFVMPYKEIIEIMELFLKKKFNENISNIIFIILSIFKLIIINFEKDKSNIQRKLNDYLKIYIDNKENYMFLEDCIFSILTDYLYKQHRYLQNALDILKNDDILKLIHINYNLPIKENIIDLTSLETFLGTYPKTKKILDNLQTILNINKILNAKTYGMFEIPESFQQCILMNQYINYYTCLNTPIKDIKTNSILPIGRILSDYIQNSNIHELFTILHLENQYKQLYIDNTFYTSTQTFIEIYNRLIKSLETHPL